MTSRLKAAAPLAIVIAVLALIWVEFSLNFTFHWVTSGDLGNGLSLPASFHLIVPTAFVSWGLFFAAGADSSALQKVAVASVVGTLGGLFVMALAPEVADLPDFWGIAVVVAVAAFLVVMVSVVGDWYYVPGIFGAFAATIFWWIATGLDNWAPDGGAFGGVLSTPYVWVWVNTLVTLLIGCALGLISVKLTGILTPAAKPDREAAQ